MTPKGEIVIYGYVEIEEEGEEADENTVKIDMNSAEQMDEEEFRAQLKKDRGEDDEDEL